MTPYIRVDIIHLNGGFTYQKDYRMVMIDKDTIPPQPTKAEIERIKRKNVLAVDYSHEYYSVI